LTSLDDDRPPRVRWPIVFLLFTAAGLLRFTYFYLDDITRSSHGTFVRRLLEESTGAYAALLLFPLLIAVERRFPLSLGRWRSNWAAHLATYAGYTAMHTTLLAVSRDVISPLIGNGAYDYGRMPVRYFMEAPEDFIAYCVFVAILTLIRVQNHLRVRELRTAAIERDAANARLEALSLRLQPHFLFNALNTISSVVYVDPVAADNMIGRLGDLLRSALRTGDRHEVTLGEELDSLRAYLTFVEARFGDRLHCRLEVDSSLTDLAVPALVLQPLAENAVHHGTALEYGDLDILIAITRHGGALRIVVENDTDEAPATTERVGTGLGTTRDRLRLLYGPDAELQATSEHGRFRVTIRLPARQLPEIPATAEHLTHARADR
jgi:two-component system, LytTR family, sensor kinase